MSRRPSRSALWSRAAGEAQAALAKLRDLQDEYDEWCANLPENLEDSPTGEKLQAILDIDLTAACDIADEAADADLPLGYGRD